MQIRKIEIENFRLLKNFQIDLEKELSLVIGKNNTGKTSILLAIDKCLNKPENSKFSFEDFNLDFTNDLIALISNETSPLEEDYEINGIKLKLYIEYFEKDNLANISKVMMDLDPTNNTIVLGFEYQLEYLNFIQLKTDYREFLTKELEKVSSSKKAKVAEYIPKDLLHFLKNNYLTYFTYSEKSIEFDNISGLTVEDNFIDLRNEKINLKDIINFKFIGARREVSNKEADKTLSFQTSKIYKKKDASLDELEAIENFKDELSNTDISLSRIYDSLFIDVVDKVSAFGGIKPNESIIKIISTLQHRELLEGNTTVIYNHSLNNELPENFNGLGYLNLISMIFEIEILIQDFKKTKAEKPSDISLLFIEEPEAHTHPQMQYVFIKNIKNLLKGGIIREDGNNRDLQYIVSSHSSHIVADSDFEDIKYLSKISTNEVIVKNLKELIKEYEVSTPQYQFLRQYLTISRAEIFFADKAILIEGDTERILIPTMMRKIDIEDGQLNGTLPLLSQNISIIEVGAYSQIFEKFIAFIGIKSLIITDLDTIGVNKKKCPVSEGKDYSNGALSSYFNKPTLQQLIKFELKNKILKKEKENWINDVNGKLCIVYQIAESDNCGRSFEEAFIHINKSFISSLKENFQSIQNAELFDDEKSSSYLLAEECIKKKTHFALDIIYHSNTDYSNWHIPSYIKEGLTWLKKD